MFTRFRSSQCHHCDGNLLFTVPRVSQTDKTYVIVPSTHLWTVAFFTKSKDKFIQRRLHKSCYFDSFGTPTLPQILSANRATNWLDREGHLLKGQDHKNVLRRERTIYFSRRPIFWPRSVLNRFICCGNVCSSLWLLNSWVKPEWFKISKYALHHRDITTMFLIYWDQLSQSQSWIYGFTLNECVKQSRQREFHHEDATDEWLPQWRHDPAWPSPFSIAVWIRPDHAIRVLYTSSCSIFLALCSNNSWRLWSLEAILELLFLTTQWYNTCTMRI